MRAVRLEVQSCRLEVRLEVRLNFLYRRSSWANFSTNFFMP